jgi:hypothetical protein
MAPTYLWNFLSSNSGGYIKKLLDQTQKSNASKNLDFERQLKSARKARGVGGQKEEKASLLNKEFETKFKEAFSSVKKHIETPRPESRRLVKMSIAESSNDSTIADEHLKVADSSNRKPFLKKISKSLSLVLNVMKPTSGLKNLTTHYMLLKFLNMLNVLVQIVFLHYMFGRNFYRYGLDFFAKLWNNEDPFYLSKQFPIISLCNFYVHQNLRQIHWNTAQCILSINIFIEKFYVIIWFWYVFLLLVNLFNIISWLIELTSSYKENFLAKYLNIYRKMNDAGVDLNRQQHKDDKDLLHKEVRFSSSDSITRKEAHYFYEDYLGNNGVLMLHLIKSVAGELIFMDLLHVLWQDYQEENQKKAANDDETKNNEKSELFNVQEENYEA